MTPYARIAVVLLLIVLMIVGGVGATTYYVNSPTPTTSPTLPGSCTLPADPLTHLIWPLIPFVACMMIAYRIYKTWENQESSFIWIVFDISLCMILIATIVAVSFTIFFGMGC
jgi:hypothetical protein